MNYVPLSNTFILVHKLEYISYDFGGQDQWLYFQQETTH